MVGAPPDLVERWVQGQKKQASQDTSSGDSANPGQGIYEQQNALAQQAYNMSMAQLKMQRDNMYHDYGMLSNGSVDPNNQFGKYQMLLGQEGSQLDSTRENAQQRGLVGPGLGNQQEAAARFQQGGTNLGFQRQVSDIGQNYTMGAQQAQYNLSAARIGARQDLLNNAITNRQFSPANPVGSAASGVQWGGQNFTNKSALAQWLAARGGNFSQWAQTHAGAAQRLG